MAGTRDRLIETAMSMFYQHGFHAIGIDRIIDEVGVTKTTFYNHFESKDELILAVLDARDTIQTRDWMRITRAKGGDEPRAQMLAMFDLLAEWFQETGFRGCMFINAAVEFPSPNDPIHLAAAKHGKHLGKEVQQLAHRAGASDPDLLTKRLMMLMSGALIARHVDMDLTAAFNARAAAELLINHHCPPVGANA